VTDLSSHTVSIDDVAAAMGREAAWLRRNWRRLERTHGFPRKIPGALRFPRAAVEAWLKAGGAMPSLPEAANLNQPGGDPVAAYAARLLQRSRP
jgi:hypothetical protein